MVEARRLIFITSKLSSSSRRGRSSASTHSHQSCSSTGKTSSVMSSYRLRRRRCGLTVSDNLQFNEDIGLVVFDAKFFCWGFVLLGMYSSNVKLTSRSHEEEAE
jgi:hypothetical protein